MIKEWTEYCQTQLNNKNWYPWNFQSVHGGLLCIGAECPLITRGKNKGKPNYRKHDKETIDTVIIPVGRLK